MWSKISCRLAPAAGFVAATSSYTHRPTTFCDKPAPKDQVFPEYGAKGFMHNTKSGFSVFLQERCQRVYFIRHAEGYHNVAEKASTFTPRDKILLKENTGMEFWDAKLTPKGEEQCAQLKASIHGTSVWQFDKPLNLDLVVVSPLTRTLQTAVISLGCPNSPGAPPFIAHELCRERIADFTCDGRRSVKELKRDFPGVDFSLVTDNDDLMFDNRKENDELCQERAMEFLEWLCARPEAHIAVVTHSMFLKNLLRAFADNVSDEDRDEVRAFPNNAEMRSVMLCAHRKFATPEVEENKAGSRKHVWRGGASL